MPRYRLVVSQRVSGWLTCTIGGAVALAFLLISPVAMGQTTGQDTAAPPDSGNPFARWFRAPVAAPAIAAPAEAQPTRSVRKPRKAKVKKRTKPVAAQPAAERPAPPAQEHAETSGWPNAEANLGAATIVPLTIKTVREMAEPEPDAPLVFENELSDIDLAAGPALEQTRPATPQATTDGSGATDNEDMERSGISARGETKPAMSQSAWLESALLLLAGALASFTAVRVFA